MLISKLQFKFVIRVVEIAMNVPVLRVHSWVLFCLPAVRGGTRTSGKVSRSSPRCQTVHFAQE